MHPATSHSTLFCQMIPHPFFWEPKFPLASLYTTLCIVKAFRRTIIWERLNGSLSILYQCCITLLRGWGGSMTPNLSRQNSKVFHWKTTAFFIIFGIRVGYGGGGGSLAFHFNFKWWNAMPYVIILTWIMQLNLGLHKNIRISPTLCISQLSWIWIGANQNIRYWLSCI